MNAQIEKLVTLIAGLKGNRFASLTYTKGEKSNGAGEQARFTVMLGFSYDNALRESLKQLQGMKLRGIKQQAKLELIASFEQSIASHEEGQRNPDYTKKNVYVPLFNGLNVSRTDGSFKLFGLVVNKVVLKNGIYREVNSARLTIAKNELRKLLPIGKFREFAISEQSLAQAKLNGDTIEFD